MVMFVSRVGGLVCMIGMFLCLSRPAEGAYNQTHDLDLLISCLEDYSSYWTMCIDPQYIDTITFTVGFSSEIFEIGRPIDNVVAEPGSGFMLDEVEQIGADQLQITVSAEAEPIGLGQVTIAYVHFTIPGRELLPPGSEGWPEPFDESDPPRLLPGISLMIDSYVMPGLQPGDADLDGDFDQLDLVAVQVLGKYLTGQAATWGEGDWDGAPGGSLGDPPAGNGFFNQLDIVAALNTGVYLQGPYAAVDAGGEAGDPQTSVGYNATTGEVWVDAPAGIDLTSINIDSAAGIFTGAPAQNLGGSFDNDADHNIFKATFGSSFGSLSFGGVAQLGLEESFLLGDLTVVGSLAGGGGLGNVDLVYVPEPNSIVLLLIGSVAACAAGVNSLIGCQSRS